MEYLTEDKVVKNEKFLKMKIKVLKKSSYDEIKVYKNITESVSSEKFFAVAFQLAVVGWGNKEYGNVEIDEDELNIKDFFLEEGVKFMNTQNSKLKPEDVTPNRLIRIFRFDISDRLEDTGETSFLYNKYAPVGFECNTFNIFPGAEHLVTEFNDIAVLLECYKGMDLRNGTDFEGKAKIVFKARGL